jgi:hypothetical protein
MKIVLFLVLVSGLMMTGSRNPQPSSDTIQRADCQCIEVRRIRGENCGTANSLRIEFRNVCSSPVNAQIYVRWGRDSDREKVGQPFNMRPGASSSYFWCQEPYESLVACE